MRRVLVIVLSVVFSLGGILTCLILSLFLLIGGQSVEEPTGQEPSSGNYSWPNLLSDARKNKVEMVHVEDRNYKIVFKDGDVKYFRGTPWEQVNETEKKELLDMHIGVSVRKITAVPTWPNKIVAVFLWVVGAAFGFVGIRICVWGGISKEQAPRRRSDTPLR